MRTRELCRRLRGRSVYKNPKNKDKDKGMHDGW